MGKETKKKISYRTEEQKEITRLVIIIVVVAVLVVGAYFLTRAFVTKDLFTHKTKEEEVVTPGQINYNVAIVGTMLNRPELEYYVVVYDSTDANYSSEMLGVVTSYNSKKKHLPVYTVDLSNKFNESFHDPDNINLEPEKVEDYRFGDVTLIRVKNGKAVKAISDLTKIKKELDV